MELQRVMMVEDEPDIRLVAQMALESIGGYTVRTCSSGAEAIEAVGEFAPDIVLLDVMMPGMDGPTTLGRLRSTTAGGAVPIVFMTAKAQPQEVARYKGLGALDVVAKPFDPLTLADQIRDIWRRGHE
jgi:CheY-like chemotaxis protein